MKKLTTLLFVLVFASSGAFAQNNAETIQNGNDNDAIVTQVGSNAASVYQGTQKYALTPQALAQANEASVTQNGNFQAYIIQGDAGTSINSTSSIDQSGTNGYAAVLQGVYQGGTAISTNATVEQKQHGNVAQIRQGLQGTTEGGSATMEQAGAENTGIIYQGVQAQSSSLDNTATLTQSGNNNSSTTIFQGSMMSVTGPGSGPGTAQGNSATIIQNGNSNGTNGNGVRINQGINGGSTFNNTGYILQDGDLNNAIINQGVGNNMRSENSDASIYQYSDNSVATVDQIGDNNSTTITQN